MKSKIQLYHFILTVFAIQLFSPFTYAQSEYKKRSLYTKGEILLKKGQNKEAYQTFEQALVQFEKAKEIDSIIETSLKLGYVSMNLRNFDDGINHYKIAAEISKNNNKNQKYLEAIDAISTTYFLLDRIDEALPLIKECVRLGKEQGEISFYTTKLVTLGYAYFNRGELDSARQYLIEGLELKKASKDTLGMALANNYLGRFYHSIGNFEKAKDYYFDNLHLRQILKDTLNYIAGMSHVATLFMDMNNLELAHEYAVQANELAEVLKLQTYKAHTIRYLAKIEEKQGNVNGALEKYLEVIKIYRANKNEDLLINSLLKVGEIYLDKDQKEIAYNHIKEANELANTTKNSGEFASTYLALGRLKLAEGKNEEAINNIQKGLEIAHDRNFKLSLMNGAKLLSDAYSEIGNFKESLNWHKEYSALKDSILIEEQQKSIFELETRFQVGQKDKKINLLVDQNSIRELKLELAHRKQLILWIGLIGIGLFSGLIFGFLKQKQRDNKLLSDSNSTISEALQDKELLLREIQHRVKNNLQVISSLLSIQSYQSKDPNIQAAVREGKDRVRSMSLIHESLYKHENLLAVDTEKYILTLATRLLHSYQMDESAVKLKTDIEQLKLDVDIMIPLGLILNELISNSLKYAFDKNEEGVINITFKKSLNELVLQVADNGRGVSRSFNLEEVNSTGYLIIKDFCTKLKGKIDVISEGGLRVEVRIPY